MKIFNLLTGRAGKTMLSATQAIVASAAVGIGGIAAWQILGSDSAPDNTFNSLGYQQEEVVYVSGSASGQYGKLEGGGTAFRAAPSKAIEMQQREAEFLRQQELEREAAERAKYEASTRASAPDAVSVGGLNEGLGNKKIEAMTPEQIKAMQEEAMRQPQDAAAAGNALADAASAAAAAGVHGAARGALASRGISMPEGSSGGATYVGMPGSVDSGKNYNGSDAPGGTSVNGLGREGASIPNNRNLRAKPSFGANVTPRGNSKDFSSLELMAKRSSEIAGNANRSANEAGRAFLASTRNSGGITVNGGEVTTGQGASSDDFGDSSSSLSGVNSALNQKMDEVLTAEEQFRNERKAMRKKLRKLIGYTFLAFVCLFPFLGWLAVKKHFNKYFAANAEYEEKYGDRSKEARAGKKIANKLKVCAKLGASGLGLFVAMIPWMLMDAFGWTTSKKSLKEGDDSAEQGRVGTVTDPSFSSSDGSTLDVQEGRRANEVSRQEAQDYAQRIDGQR